MTRIKKGKIGNYLLLSATMLSLGVNSVLALTKPNYVNDIQTSNANLVMEGKNIVEPNEEFSLNIMLKDVSGSNLMGIQGDLEVLDDCVSLVSLESVNNVVAFNNKFAYSDFDGFGEDTMLVKANFKANDDVCNTTISVDKIKMAFVDGTKIKYDDSASASIKVIAKALETEKVKNDAVTEVIPRNMEKESVIVNNTNKEEKEIKENSYLKIITRKISNDDVTIKNIIDYLF